MQQSSGRNLGRQAIGGDPYIRVNDQQRPRGGMQPGYPNGRPRPANGRPAAGNTSNVRRAGVKAPNADPKRRVVANAAGKTAKKEKDPNKIGFWSKQRGIDIPMFIIVLVLLALGITMMFSAGHAWAYQKKNDPFYYVMRQLPAAGLGLLGMFLLTLFDYRFLRHEFTIGRSRKITFSLAHILLIAMLFLNFLCLPLGVSNIEDGPKRWLQIPVFGRFQPSDFLKVAVIIFMAYYIHRSKDKIRSFAVGLLRPGMLAGVIGIILILIQSHLSGFLIIFMVMAAMLFVGGVNIKPALVVLPIAVLAIYLLVEFSPFGYYFERFKYIDPLSQPSDGSYQNYQSALAVGSGGIWGKGFGNSSQKYYYLPEAPNDFVYAILVEEFGLVGGVLVMLMFLLFTFRGFQIASHAEDKFGCLIATGITFQIGLQAFLNIGVNVCCVPNTGISLPFFSYGGTALMIQLWEMGLLLSVSKRAKLR